MPLDPQIQAYIDAYIDARLTKRRIPELEENTDPLSGEDRLPIWIKAANKTRWEDLGDLLTFFAAGGDGTTTVPDSAAKGEITDDITAAQAGSNTLSLPAYAGKQFTLSIDGRVYKDDEFEVLNAGGFKINIPGFTLLEGMRYTMRFAEPLATNTPAGGGFLRGNVLVETSTVLTAEDARKRIKIRGGNTGITLTLPSVASLSDNDFYVFETHITNTRQQAIKTSGGQNIYFNSQSLTTLYLGPGEVLILLRDGDGWYPLDNYAQIYREVGHPVGRYALEAGDVLLKGQLLPKVDAPRLAQKVVGFGGAYVTRAEYDADPDAYRGCYVDWDADNLRLPNLMDMFLRGVESEFGADTNRTHNAPGGYQADGNKAHGHGYRDRYWAETAGLLADAVNKEQMPNSGNYNGKRGSGDTDNDNTHFLYLDTTTGESGGEEATVKNSAVYWVTKI